MLINVNGDELEHAALDALTAMSRCLTADEKTITPTFAKLVGDILSGIDLHDSLLNLINTFSSRMQGPLVRTGATSHDSE